MISEIYINSIKNIITSHEFKVLILFSY